MKKNLKKIAATAVCMSMVIACVTGCDGKKAESAVKEEIKAEEQQKEKEKADIEKAEEMAAPEHSSTSGKNETVYIIKESDGTKKTIVSEWLKNPSGGTTMKDVADLDNIEVVKGDAKLEKNENGDLTWNASGADIYYSGTTDKSAPVDVDITYTLDGAKLKSSELKGKSGHLVIEVSYKNTMTKTLTDKKGNEYKISMPFIMSTGMILNNTKFSNVSAKNGEVVNDGERTVVMGVGFPGLYDSLGLDTIDLSSEEEGETLKKLEKNDIPENFTVECDVKDCDEITALTVGKVFDLNSLNIDLNMDSLNSNVDEMTDGMKKLIDGSTDLHDGIKKVNDGAKSLKKGAKTLSSGAASLSKGADKLAKGTNTLASGAKSLNDGLNTFKKSLPSADEAKALASGSASVKKTIDSMHSATEKYSISENDIEAVTAKLKKLVASNQLDAGTMKQILEVYNAYYQLEKGVNGLYKGYGNVNKAVQAYPKIVSGVASVSKGAKQVANGANSVNKGAKELSSGASSLSKGAKKLSSGTNTLADGTQKLVKGSNELKDGLKKFDDKAVDKIANLISDNLVPLSDRFEALKAYAETYSSFAGTDSTVACSTVFVFKNA